MGRGRVGLGLGVEACQLVPASSHGEHCDAHASAQLAPARLELLSLSLRNIPQLPGSVLEVGDACSHGNHPLIRQARGLCSLRVSVLERSDIGWLETLGLSLCSLNTIDGCGSILFPTPDSDVEYASLLGRALGRTQCALVGEASLLDSLVQLADCILEVSLSCIELCRTRTLLCDRCSVGPHCINVGALGVGESRVERVKLGLCFLDGRVDRAVGPKTLRNVPSQGADLSVKRSETFAVLGQLFLNGARLTLNRGRT